MKTRRAYLIPSIHLTLDEHDVVLPCPFCGTSALEGLELQNTHTASYWISCPCGAEIHGKAYGTDVPSNELTMRHHRMAKKSTIKKWNTRNG